MKALVTLTLAASLAGLSGCTSKADHEARRSGAAARDENAGGTTAPLRLTRGDVVMLMALFPAETFQEGQAVDPSALTARVLLALRSGENDPVGQRLLADLKARVAARSP